MILFGGRKGSSVPGDKKPQNGSSGPLPALHDLSNSMPNVFTECDKKQIGHAGY